MSAYWRANVCIGNLNCFCNSKGCNVFLSRDLIFSHHCYLRLRRHYKKCRVTSWIHVVVEEEEGGNYMDVMVHHLAPPKQLGCSTRLNLGMHLISISQHGYNRWCNVILERGTDAWEKYDEGIMVAIVHWENSSLISTLCMC